MATGAAAMILQCAFAGAISMHDMEIKKRPYHKNCGCALHSLKGVCSETCPQQRNISFPKKKSWNDCSLSMEVVSKSSSSHSSSLSDSSIRKNRKDANGKALAKRQ